MDEGRRTEKERERLVVDGKSSVAFVHETTSENRLKIQHAFYVCLQFQCSSSGRFFLHFVCVCFFFVLFRLHFIRLAWLVCLLAVRSLSVNSPSFYKSAFKYSLGFLVATLCGWHNLKCTILLMFIYIFMRKCSRSNEKKYGEAQTMAASGSDGAAGAFNTTCHVDAAYSRHSLSVSK